VFRGFPAAGATGALARLRRFADRIGVAYWPVAVPPVANRSCDDPFRSSNRAAIMPSITTPSRAVGYFLPYQIRWICDERPVCVAEKSRRIGFTHASAFRAVERRLRCGTDLFYTSTDLTASREFIEECCRWARMFQAVAREEGEHVADEGNFTALSIRFSNGARIVAGSSNPHFFRGKGGDVDADEFAFHAQPRELYKVMQPAALVWGHQLRIWSTHNGAGSFFHRLVQSASNDGSSARSAAPDAPASDAGLADNQPITGQSIARHRVTLIDAVNQGLVERIRGLSSPDLVARRDFIEEIRSSCPDEASFREEYLCEPSADGSALLSHDMVAACEAANLRLLDVPALSAVAATEPALGPLYAGFDVGRRQDASVLWVLERVGDVLWTRAIHRMGNASFAEQEQLIDRLLSSRRVRRLCVDATGIGMMLGERLAGRYGHRVEPIHFTADVKSAIAMPLVRLFEGRLVRIPSDPAVRDDLRKVRRTVTAAHHVRLAAPRDADGHADRFWALALACHAAEQSPAPPTPGAARKPTGW
jgi:phage FluMu gp28-like protein